MSTTSYLFYGNNCQTQQLSYKLFLNIGLHVSVYTDHPQVLKSSTMCQYRPKHVVLYLRIACMIIVVFDGYFHKIYQISTTVWIISNLLFVIVMNKWDKIKLLQEFQVCIWVCSSKLT